MFIEGVVRNCKPPYWPVSPALSPSVTGLITSDAFIMFSFNLKIGDLIFFFFFSSRRRHTRLQGDWSSDVCSSDLAGLLSVDALGSATLLPTTQVKNLTVDSNATKVGSLALGIGYGVRVGVLRGSFPIPSVSVSVMRRSLPRLRYGTLAPSSLSSGDAFEFDTDLKATNVRVAASMKLLLLDVAVGVGFDKYTSTAHLRFYDNPPTNSVRTVTLDLNNSRQVLFANAGLDVLLLKLVAEIGYQTGKDQRLSTTYADFDPKAGHVYGGAGVRFSL